MKVEHKCPWALFVLLLAAMLLCAGCSGQPSAPPVEEDPQEVVVEPGHIPETPPAGQEGAAEDGSNASGEEEEVSPFVDKGESSTTEDLDANLKQIESYYFEQNIPYVDGHIYMQIWYKDGLMKVVTSVGGYGLSEYYYDYKEQTVINYAPGSGTPAMRLPFDPGNPDAPDNPKLQNYLECTASGFESIDRQTCMILDTVEGSKLWVSTATGFPLLVYYEVSLVVFWSVLYINIRMNTVKDEELLLDPSVEVVDYSGSQF
ncbi:MAG: hypothetical protein Q4B50_01305 [Bacillota bacterium]|nr:hypothetical protein [Bacillota bacterium]